MAFAGLDPETHEKLFGKPEEIDSNDDPEEIEDIKPDPDPPVKPADQPTQSTQQTQATVLDADAILDAGEAKAQMRQEILTTYGNVLTDKEIEQVMSEVANTAKGDITVYRGIEKFGGHKKLADAMVGEKLRKGQLKSENKVKRETTSVGSRRETGERAPSNDNVVSRFGNDLNFKAFLDGAAKSGDKAG